MRISDWSSDVCSSDLPLFEGDLHLSTGFTTRQNAEFVLLGRIGSPARARADIRQIIIAPVAEHSRKPDEFFRRAQHYGHGPYLDMFAGGERPGWTAIGWSHREGERSDRSEEHTSEIPSLMRIPYAVLCLKKTNTF